MVPLSTVSDRSSTAVVLAVPHDEPVDDHGRLGHGGECRWAPSAAQGGGEVVDRALERSVEPVEDQELVAHRAVRLEGLREVGAHRGEAGRAPDLRRVATDRRARLVELRALGGVPLRCAPDVVDVGVLRRGRDGPLLAAAADQDRQPRLDRLRVVGRVVQREEPAREVRAVVAQQRRDHRDALLEAVRQVVRVHQVDAVRRVLVDLPPGAEPGDRPAAAHVVERGELVRHDGGMPVGAAQDHRTEPAAGGERRQRGQQRHRLEHPLVGDRVVVGVAHEVVAQVDRVRPEPVGGLRELAHLRPRAAVVEDHADVHGGHPVRAQRP